MDINTVVNTAGIPFLMCGICLYYAYMMLVRKDYKGVVPRGKTVRHPEEFCREGGKIMIGFGIASALMGVLMLASPLAGLVEIAAATAAVMVLWRKMAAKYE